MSSPVVCIRNNWIIGITILLLAANTLAGGRGEAPWVGDSFSGAPCNGSDPKLFGPYDYNLDEDKLGVVQRAHFTPETEALMSGGAGVYPAGGINYTLTVIPNHHRALNAAIRLHFELKSRAASVSPEEALRSPVECYLQRAIKYSPRDATVHMLYAMYLHRSQMLEPAITEYKIALQIQPHSPNIEYNYALALVDAGDYETARKISDRLYASGFPLPGLKNKLANVSRAD